MPAAHKDHRLLDWPLAHDDEQDLATTHGRTMDATQPTTWHHV
ncbi:hypothetical protein [Actinomadura sp. BRA 177]|nr:hypothetical protein [Actinomadura sp. BRA 177]